MSELIGSQKAEVRTPNQASKSPAQLAYENLLARQKAISATAPPFDPWDHLPEVDRRAWEASWRDISFQALEPVNAILKAEEKKLAQHYLAPAEERLKGILARYRDRASEVISGAKQFRDDLLVWFRALSMVASMAGNAATHKEKDARIRGLIELIEQDGNKLRELTFDFNFRQFRYHSAFESDFR